MSAFGFQRGESLPIDAHLEAIVEVARRSGQLVLDAPTGSGKTTRLPWALATALQGEVWVLEPRRLAARLSARRVASLLGEPVGERIGYEIRFERKVSKRTRVRYLTEALLTRHLLEDPHLEGVAAVLLDEFHERNLHADLGLALLTRLQATERPELILGVLSATLEGLDLSPLWPRVEVFRTTGRAHPVEVEHLEREEERRLPELVVRAARRLLREGLGEAGGQILCFLPGAGAIAACARDLEPLTREGRLEVARLHGELSAREQDAALEPTGRPRIILSTNVAESSITVPGVVAVIDSGLARMPGFDPWSGLPRLEERKVSRASLTQRAGRAGRLGPGRCLRLFTEHDARARLAQDPPEIARQDLTELRLTLGGFDLGLEELPFLTPPPAETWEHAGALLRHLGLLEGEHALTPAGRQAVGWPLPPRLSAVLHHCREVGEAHRGCALVALLSERDLLARAPWGDSGALPTGSSDPLDRLERLEAAAGSGFAGHRLRALGLDGGRSRSVWRVAGNLRRRLGVEREERGASPESSARLQRALLAGWPDRVAGRRAPRSERFVLADGGEVVAGPTTIVREAPLIVALEARREGGQGRSPRLHLASAIEPDWLIEVDPEGLVESIEVSWNEGGDRVEAFSRLRYGLIVLTESRVPAEEQPETAHLLAAALRERGLAALGDPEGLESLLGRLELLHELDPALELPELSEEGLWRFVEAACVGARSFSELQRRDWVRTLEARIPGPARAKLARWLPESMALPRRQKVRIRYARGQRPYLASRLQDFFGLKETPTLAEGRLPLQLHLLAPNGRPVQITQDLPGFWSRHYPQVRRELRGRYPRHDWPETP
ncbi:MAG: ATP-dependent helicase HrpB [Deltaproteobacteria bacterium]|nr:ATP-dependent helicase HrpB [Deltaproteobacteria bacterium]